MTAVLASIRPDSWNFPLFLHIFGAMLLVGAVTAAVVAQLTTPAVADPDRLRRFSFRTMLFVAIPSWFLMAIGAEWIILTPHYVRPDWMGLTRERDIDDDPRPYVKGLRAFSEKHGVALADASLRYGRLWRQGIPYSALMLNSINHPDARGMSLFADALMELFP